MCHQLWKLKYILILLFFSLLLSLNVAKKQLLCERDSPDNSIRSHWEANKGITWQHATYGQKFCGLCDWMNIPLAIIYSYHNQCNALRLIVQKYQQLPIKLKEKVRILFVDDHAEVPAAACMPGPVDGVEILHVDTWIHWNVAGSRNLGAYYSCAKNHMMLDIDAHLNQRSLEIAFELISKPSSENMLFHINRHLIDYGPEPHTIHYSEKIHPAMMMLSRELYWRQLGCDEDFSGVYGGTHMKFHIDRVGGKVINPPEFFMCTLVSELDEMIKHSVPPLNRSKELSHQIFHAKESGQMPWNRTILRFDWHRLEENEYHVNFDTEHWPEASSIAMHSLTIPPDQAAFGRKFWGIDETKVHESDSYCS